MELGEALEFIREHLKDAVESRHFKEQCNKREVSDVLEIIETNPILGILEQSKGLYKLWFFYEKDKDLNIIVQLTQTGKLILVTLFPCYSGRRKR